MNFLDLTLTYIDRLSKAVSWQLIFLILLILGRKHLGSIILSFANLLGRANKIMYDGKSFSIEAQEIINKQKEEIKDLNITINEISQGNIGGKLKNQTIEDKIFKSSEELMEKSIKIYSDKENNDLDNIEEKEKVNDPLKGKFGMKAETDRAILKATVTNLPNKLYKINIEVVSKYKESPITGFVNFYLHPTFNPKERSIKAENGIAKLTLVSYGSFTLGAECEGKQMELDLAELSGVSEKFKRR